MCSVDDWGLRRWRASPPPSTAGFENATFGWRVDAEDMTARRCGASGAPATILGPSSRGDGDGQFTFHVNNAPPGVDLELGLCRQRPPAGARLGWCGAAVSLDGQLRFDDHSHAHGVGKIGAGSDLIVRVRRGFAYFRHGRSGPWNGQAAADPLLEFGGVPLDGEAEVFPAICSDAPYVEVSADFGLWEKTQLGFDPSPARTSLAWQLSEDSLTAIHMCSEDAPATLLGPPARRGGDREVRLRIDELPAGGAIQIGLSNTAHLLDNELGWKESLGVGADGVVRQGGVSTNINIGPIGDRELVTVRVCDGLAYFRRGPTGHWNGNPSADPIAGRGGLPVRFDGPLHPAIYAERPGTAVTGDFIQWVERTLSGRLRSGPTHSCHGLFDQQPMPPIRDRERRRAG